MSEDHNRHAGQGAVLLDIGGDVGALVVRAPASLAGTEIEIRAVDATGARPTHVAVLPRPTGNGLSHSAVFAELERGTYELCRRPDGPVALRVTITGGEVQQADWPIG
ncbi:MAG TPA: hypothetical protein VGN18_14470 [Jatrophihabitans sp.]|uniref:hypothetical protein n=1 Tax=Jatrophihabitans sp. TaxID=1932789 RepID=UPI002E0A5275|nr:hypothetical protein [Jatrophihabitans sp.]